MPFRDGVWERQARQGQIGFAALKISIALDNIVSAFEGLQNKEDISENISEIRRMSKDLEEIFNEFTGWYPDEQG